MNILVTGASGFIGSQLAIHLIKQGHNVFITAKEGENKCPECTVIGYHFNELPWNDLKIDTLFHLASCTDTMVHDRHYMMQVNYDWSKKLIDDAIEHRVKHIIYSSSAAVYGRYRKLADEVIPFRETDDMNPLNVYGESKAKLDSYAMGLDHHIVGLRYSNVYGGLSEEHKGRCASMPWQILKTIRSGEAPTLFKWGDQARDFVHVKDVVQANILALKNEKKGIFNIGAGKMWSFNDIVDICQNLLNTNYRTNYVDNYIQKWYQDYNAVNIDWAKQQLGYEPAYMLEEGLKELHDVINN